MRLGFGIRRLLLSPKSARDGAPCSAESLGCRATCFWRLAGALRRAGPDPHSFSRGMPGGHGFVTACVRKELPGEDGRGGCSMMDGAVHQRRRRAVAARPKHLRPLSCPRPWRRRTLGLDRPCGSDCRSRSERRSRHVRRAGCVVVATRQLTASPSRRFDTARTYAREAARASGSLRCGESPVRILGC